MKLVLSLPLRRVIVRIRGTGTECFCGGSLGAREISSGQSDDELCSSVLLCISLFTVDSFGDRRRWLLLKLLYFVLRNGFVSKLRTD